MASTRALPLLLTALAGISCAQQYQPNWESVQRHTVPQWFDDAKFGIFIHWGIYSVPAWAPTGRPARGEWFRLNPYAEWYMNTIAIPDSPSRKHHNETYGERFSYLDFAPEFNREVKKWNPEVWARVFREVGARYVVLTTKHHDGFTLWPSRVKNPHRPADRQGTERDLVGELTRAVRGQGLKMGLYYSGGLDWSFEPGPIRTSEELRKLIPQTEEYARYADAQWRELIERYQPAVMWNDIGYPKKGDLPGIFAEYLNKAPDGAINNRFSVPFSDFTTPEYKQYAEITPKKWETCRGLGFSFGNNQAEGPEQVLAPDALVRLLIDVVSKNGNLLLNIGPKPDGTIPEIQLSRLRELGKWLAVNGEGIYGSRPWTRPGTGEVRFTTKGGKLYAFLLARPKGAMVTLEAVAPADGATVRLLGTEGALKWARQGDAIAVTMPASYGEQLAYTLEISALR